MGTYVIRRLLISIPVLVGISMITYIIIDAAPGDPVSALVNPEFQADPQALQALRERMGLNKPLPVRYALWLREVAQGNLGYSLVNRRSVADRVRERIWPTVQLSAAALFIAVALAIPLGILSAARQYSLLDHAGTAFAFIAVSIPTFFFGLGMIYLFSLKIDLFPVGGMTSLGAESDIVDRLRHLIMPALVLGLVQVAVLMRYTRASMLEVLGQDYIRTARAKGLPERRVIYRHALRNALIPVVTVLGLDLGRLFNGAVITETIFQWPGMGRLTIEAVLSRDFPVLMGIVLISSIMILTANLLTDIAYALIDPRIRYG
jgi:peptide/nickel transport system permease protein